MKNLIIAVFFAGLLVSPAENVNAQDMSAKEIVAKADQKNRGETSQGTMTMKIERPGWERTIQMKSWSKSDDFFLIYITAPAKEKGQVFLKRYKEMWNWIPSIDRMVKIPPSMMMQSWMGSDFTNDDLVKQSSIVKDYDHTLLGEETVRGMLCYKIELIPKPDAPVVWGKIVTWITKDGFNGWKNEYYDEDMELINVENAYDLKDFGDRTLPARFVIEPVDDPGNKTILLFEEMTFNKPIEDGFFTQQNMKRVR
ncbi:MAG: outer membrane lipoprotein-sorting protein [Bacteroidales bacterium]|nr:outer membrane lipoprotein-sorting protein [Bacteroidales bacterium]